MTRTLPVRQRNHVLDGGAEAFRALGGLRHAAARRHHRAQRRHAAFRQRRVILFSNQNKRRAFVGHVQQAFGRFNMAEQEICQRGINQKPSGQFCEPGFIFVM